MEQGCPLVRSRAVHASLLLVVLVATQLARAQSSDAELVMTLPGLKPLSKAEALQQTLFARARLQRYVTSELAVRVFKESAVVTGRVQRTRRVRDMGMYDDWYFTNVYLRRGGAWKVIAWHGSPAPPP